MNLKEELKIRYEDKPCYPVSFRDEEGLTFRERLIIALASNPKMMVDGRQNDMPFVDVALCILEQADAIINQLKEK